MLSSKYIYKMEVGDPEEYGIWRDRGSTCLMKVADFNKMSPALKRGHVLHRTFKACSWELACSIYEYLEHNAPYIPMR